MRSRSALVILIVLVAAAPARAQGDFATLPAQVGDVVYVTGFGAFIDWLRVGRKQIYRGTGPRFGRKA
jgi:hypothetical protein